MARRLKQKRLRSTPEWQAQRKTKRAEKRVQKLKSAATAEAKTGSSGAYQPGGFLRLDEKVAALEFSAALDAADLGESDSDNEVDLHADGDDE